MMDSLLRIWTLVGPEDELILPFQDSRIRMDSGGLVIYSSQESIDSVESESDGVKISETKKSGLQHRKHGPDPTLSPHKLRRPIIWSLAGTWQVKLVSSLLL
jgi:hypothetical protein